MAPVALAVLLSGHDVLATILFAITAATDFLDGQIARRTHTVSKVGQLLDPAVDRLLMICAVVGLLIVGRLPLWIVIVVLLRDAFLIVGGAWLLRTYEIRVPVIYAGKFATTFLFIGLAGLMLNMPLVPGLGLCDFAWLPGFNSVSSSWGIWFVYIGLCLALATTVYYVVVAYGKLKKARANERK
jgi:cardiolipin synthase